ncbi:MAG: hypothetical protein OQJ84_08815 [Xanthomonadales bacterium]|nr:hypothetical protein [Xanthomonadales bacterium]
MGLQPSEQLSMMKSLIQALLLAPMFAMPALAADDQAGFDYSQA